MDTVKVSEDISSHTAHATHTTEAAHVAHHLLEVAAATSLSGLGVAVILILPLGEVDLEPVFER